MPCPEVSVLPPGRGIQAFLPQTKEKEKEEREQTGLHAAILPESIPGIYSEHCFKTLPTIWNLTEDSANLGRFAGGSCSALLVGSGSLVGMAPTPTPKLLIPHPPLPLLLNSAAHEQLQTSRAIPDLRSKESLFTD